MDANKRHDGPGDAAPATEAQFNAEPAPAEVAAWEQVDPGRYMPRRIKGSYKGRALG